MAQPSFPISSSTTLTDSRRAFIRKTYAHLFLAILGFIGIEVILFQTGIAQQLLRVVLAVNWLLILGAFMLVGWFASRVAANAETLGAQYGGLALYTLAEAILFAPILFIAEYHSGGGVIQSAGLATLLGTGGLTLIAFTTKKDFSFLGSLLKWGGIAALVLIVCGVLFGFQLGTFFSAAMVAFAGAAILYDTSNILHHYPEDKYVSASLQLFASVALMFWYLLQLMNRR